MIRMVIASFRTRVEDGYTFIELMVVLLLMTTLLLLAIPSFNRVKEAAVRKAYIAEAERVSMEVGAYLAEESYEDMTDPNEISYRLVMYPLGSPDNPITGRIDGYTKGAKLLGVQFRPSTFKYYGIIYQVGGYEIEVYPEDGEPKVTRQPDSKRGFGR